MGKKTNKELKIKYSLIYTSRSKSYIYKEDYKLHFYSRSNNTTKFRIY